MSFEGPEIKIGESNAPVLNFDNVCATDEEQVSLKELKKQPNPLNKRIELFNKAQCDNSEHGREIELNRIIKIWRDQQIETLEQLLEQVKGVSENNLDMDGDINGQLFAIWGNKVADIEKQIRDAGDIKIDTTRLDALKAELQKVTIDKTAKLYGVAA